MTGMRDFFKENDNKCFPKKTLHHRHLEGKKLFRLPDYQMTPTNLSNRSDLLVQVNVSFSSYQGHMI